MPSIALKAQLYQILRTVCLMHITICPQLHKGLHQDGEQDLGVTIPICDFIRSPSALTLLKQPSQEDLGILSPRTAFKALLYSKRERCSKDTGHEEVCCYIQPFIWKRGREQHPARWEAAQEQASRSVHHSPKHQQIALRASQRDTPHLERSPPLDYFKVRSPATLH